MKRSEIKNAYDSIAPSREAKERMLSSILSAASQPDPVRKDDTMYRRNHKPVLIAAIVALMVLLMGCAVVALNLGDLKIGEYTYTESRYIDENGNKIPETEKTRDVISLQGIAGSPSQLAAREWYEFESTYDVDWATVDSDDYEKPEEYAAYFVYDQNMQDKVDEICEKYGLKLAGTIAYVQHWDEDIFYESLGIDSLLKKDAQVRKGNGSGYFYECGNFKLEFGVTLNSPDVEWKREVYISMRYADKAYLDTVFETIADAGSAEQWTYTIEDGSQVLVVKTEDSVSVFCDREDAFISVSFSIYHQYDDNSRAYMSDRDVELLIDAIDFTIKPQKPDMDAVKVKLEKSNQNYMAEQEAMYESMGDPYVKDSYQDYIEDLLNYASGEYTYGFADVNGDGFEELLIGELSVIEYFGGDENCFTEVITLKDGKTKFFFSTTLPTYLCEGYALESNQNSEYCQWYGYYTLGTNYDPEKMCCEKYEFISYDKYDEVWKYSDFSAIADTVISEKEAKDIMDSYSRISLEMKPISEFPMDE